MGELYRLVWTAAFLRTAKKGRKARPWLRTTPSAVLHTLERNPAAPSLRVHPSQGALEGKQAARLNYSDRIVLRVERRDREIVLLDIGGHDEVYR